MLFKVGGTPNLHVASMRFFVDNSGFSAVVVGHRGEYKNELNQ
jgi:hypothetical protein